MHRSSSNSPSRQRFIRKSHSRRAGLPALLLAAMLSLPTAGAQSPAKPARETAELPLQQLLGGLLQRSGINPAPVPGHTGTSGAAAGVAAKSLPASAQASGIIVRFSDPAVQQLAAADQAPPSALLADIAAALATPLHYARAMSGGMHVLGFESNLPLERALALAQQLQQLPGIELAEPDVIAHPQMVSHDPGYAAQWSLRSPAAGYAGAINAESAWDYTTGENDVVVAVVDSGILPHPDLRGRLLPGYDFVSDPRYSNDGNGRDADASDPGDYAAAGECGAGKPTTASSWHGTHVAGIIGADGSNLYGVAGVAWKTSILPVRVLGKCGASSSDIADGIKWAAGLPVPGVPLNPYPARIINVSLGGLSATGCSLVYREAIKAATIEGALIVVAAGNAQVDVATYSPANCDGVLTVMATDRDGKLASYSNYQFSGRIAAPGGDIDRHGSAGGILSTVSNGTQGPSSYETRVKQGTSMAAPHVSGVAALALAMHPGLSSAELSTLLQMTSAPFPYSYECTIQQICGSGIVDALESVSGAALLSNYQLVYEFYNVDLRHYFRTGSALEAKLVNKGEAGPGWQDTQDYFYAWSEPSSELYPVCRFYGTPGIGPNSHFYTASPAECELVKRDPGWTYEGIVFYAKLPNAGRCPAGAVPIYRAYNMRWMYNDSNHRYTANRTLYEQLVAQGWAAEGVALCVAAG